MTSIHFQQVSLVLFLVNDFQLNISLLLQSLIVSFGIRSPILGFKGKNTLENLTISPMTSFPVIYTRFVKKVLNDFPKTLLRLGDILRYSVTHICFIF